MEIRTLPLDNFGLVSSVFDQLDIADLIDDRLPKKRNHSLEPTFRTLRSEIGIFTAIDL